HFFYIRKYCLLLRAMSMFLAMLVCAVVLIISIIYTSKPPLAPTPIHHRGDVKYPGQWSTKYARTQILPSENTFRSPVQARGCFVRWHSQIQNRQYSVTHEADTSLLFPGKNQS